jgi:hypothetical protein
MRRGSGQCLLKEWGLTTFRSESASAFSMNFILSDRVRRAPIRFY